MTTSRLTIFLTTGLLALGAQSASAADFVHKSFACPLNQATLVGTPDGNINLQDIIISSDAPTDVVISYAGGEQGNRKLMRVYLGGNDTVVSNFSNGVNGERNAKLVLRCTGNAQVDVTVVGSGDIE
jgi:hypothetical protein